MGSSRRRCLAVAPPPRFGLGGTAGDAMGLSGLRRPVDSGELTPSRQAALRLPRAPACCADAVGQLLRDAGVAKEVELRCTTLILQEKLALAAEARAISNRAEESGRRAEESGRRAEEAGLRAEAAGRRVEEASLRAEAAGRRVEEVGLRAEEARREALALSEKLREAAAAVEVAKSRTMDMMRERGMVHARGILEVAELFEAPLYPKSRDNRVNLWGAILAGRPALAACLDAKAGWSEKRAPRQIDALFQNLNARMHQTALPEAAAANGGIQLILGGSGSGLSQAQSSALSCICEAYFIRYNVVTDLGDLGKCYPGVTDPGIRVSYEQSVNGRTRRLAGRAAQSGGGRRLRSR